MSRKEPDADLRKKHFQSDCRLALTVLHAPVGLLQVKLWVLYLLWKTQNFNQNHAE